MILADSVVEEIKARVDLADLISSYGIPVKIAGASKKACCPFHHEKTPSFNINDNKGYYHCFGCGESGDAIKFVMKYEGLTFIEAVRKLAEQCGITIEERDDPAADRSRRIYALLAELAQFYNRCLQKTNEAELAREYLKKRDLGEEIQAKYLIGYAPNGVANILKWAEKHGYTSEEVEAAGVIKAPDRPGDKGYHRFGGRLMFSIRDKRGRVVGFSGRQLVEAKNTGKYVNSPETDVFKKSKVLYGFDTAAAAITRASNREVIVCEGQIDCIRLQTSGFPNAVAGQGTAFTDEHVKMLKKAADQVALVYDDDNAGHKATIKSARLCLAAELPVRVVSLPGGDDPDSFLRAHPAEEFKRMLDNAESIMSFQARIERAKEANPDTMDAINRVTKELLTTISVCSSAILRATMIDEVSKLLKLPRIALDEELGKMMMAAPKVVPKPPSPKEEEYQPEIDFEEEEPLPGEEAATVLPPPPIELEFCEFLLAHEDDAEAKKVQLLIGEFLPDQVFTHDFTRRFVKVWSMHIEAEEDLIAPWSDELEPLERRWFDAFLVRHTWMHESSEQINDRLRKYVVDFWFEYLRRLRGGMSAPDTREEMERNQKITLDLKRIKTVKWDTVKELVREWIKIGN